MILIDGKKIAAEMKLEIAARVNEIMQSGGKIPHLVAVPVSYTHLRAHET